MFFPNYRRSPGAKAGYGNGGAMQSLENDTTVSHPSHSPLEDADETTVSHIPTALDFDFGFCATKTCNPQSEPWKCGRRR